MAKRKHVTPGVERHYLYELWAMDTELLKEHMYAVNDAVLYHREKMSDVERYRYRIERILKVKQWLDVEDKALND
tara:strand:+ start:169 stop:393 length:225 start_codon:yes stop_codon:yes gene_type:complete